MRDLAFAAMVLTVILVCAYVGAVLLDRWTNRRSQP